MKPVGYFYQNNTDIFGHCKKQFSEILGLLRCNFVKHATRYFCESINNMGNFWSEEVFDVFCSVISIFNHIVQKRRTDGSRA